jgi:hypothetical protein
LDLSLLIQIGTLIGMVLGPYGVWVVMQKRVLDLEVWRAKRESADEAVRLERERQQEAWWKEVDASKAEVARLDKTCAVATGNLSTRVDDLTGRVNLHTTTNLSAIIGLVKNYNEMLEEAVNSLREAMKR